MKKHRNWLFVDHIQLSSLPLLFLLMKIICLVREREKKKTIQRGKITLFLFRHDCSLNMLSEAALSSNHYQRNI